MARKLTVTDMGRGKKTIVLVFSISMIVVTVGFFLLDIEKSSLNNSALISLLLSLLISMVAMSVIVEQKRLNGSVFFSAGLSSTVLLYLVAVIISILLSVSSEIHLRNFIFVQILIYALFFIVVIVFRSFSSHIHQVNTEIYDKQQSGEYNKPKRGGF